MIPILQLQELLSGLQRLRGPGTAPRSVQIDILMDAVTALLEAELQRHGSAVIRPEIRITADETDSR